MTPLEIEDSFYRILAGAGKATLLCAAVDSGLVDLLGGAALDETEIIARLALSPLRGHKWLVLLETTELLELVVAEPRRYTLGPLLAALAAPATRYFYREFLRFWRTAAAHEMVSTVRGGPVPYPVRYPPQSDADVALLHEWMRVGVDLTLATLLSTLDLSAVHRLLDVGGGDASMACGLTARLPELTATVFNLPQPAALGRARVAELGATRVNIVEGDFFKDELPGNFDLVLFSRVLADWPPDVCRMLAAKAFNALVPGGRVVVCEPFRDHNPDLAIAWEHGYLPYDDFGAYVYKSVPAYQDLLAQAGFGGFEAHGRISSIHGVLVGSKPTT